MELPKKRGGGEISKKMSNFNCSPDTCTEKFYWCQLGAERRVKRVQTRERGHPSAPAEFDLFSFLYFRGTYYLPEGVVLRFEI